MTTALSGPSGGEHAARDAATLPGRTPLSPAQVGTADLHQQLETSALTLSALDIVRPGLDAELFTRAVDIVFRDIDGTRVLVERAPDGDWFQYVAERPGFTLQRHDLRDADDPRAEAGLLVDRLVTHRMELDGSEPLVLQDLILVSEAESWWLTRSHHVVLDGYAAQVARQYALDWYAHLTGARAEEPATPASIREFWAQRVPTPAGKLQEWAEEFGEMPRRMSLSARPEEFGAPKHRVEVLVPASDFAAFREKYRVWTNPFTALVAGYTARLTGDSHVLLGFVSAGRFSSAERQAMTMMARIAPLQLRVDAGASVADVGVQVRTAISRIRSHGDFTAEDVCRAVPTAWRRGRIFGPVVNVIPFEAHLTLPGHEVVSKVLNRGQTMDFELAVVPQGESLLLDLTANIGAYTPAETRRHAQRLAHLVHEAAFSDAPLMDLEPSLPGELQAIEQLRGCGVEVLDDVGRVSLVGEDGRIWRDGVDTGRLGHIDDEGRLVDVCDAADRLLVNGVYLWLNRVRDAVLALPGVRQVALAPTTRRIEVLVTPERPGSVTDQQVVDAVRPVVPRALLVRSRIGEPPTGAPLATR